MSLAAKIKEVLDERASNPIVKQAREAAVAAQKAIEEGERLRAEAYKLAKQQAADQKKALTRNLRDLLTLVDARNQLDELREIWKTGKIDRNPMEIPDLSREFTEFNDGQPLPNLSLPTSPALALALRHKFRDAEEHQYRDGYGYTSSYTYWARRELVVVAAVGLDNDHKPFVATFYGSHRSPNSPVLNVYWYGRETYLHPNMGRSHLIAYNPPESIFPNSPTTSKAILEEQLLKVGTDAESFRELQAQANQRILDDPHLPRKARALISPHWYTRAVGKLPIVNAFLPREKYR